LNEIYQEWDATKNIVKTGRYTRRVENELHAELESDRRNLEKKSKKSSNLTDILNREKNYRRRI
jgi:hypothetical protein